MTECGPRLPTLAVLALEGHAGSMHRDVCGREAVARGWRTEQFKFTPTCVLVLRADGASKPRCPAATSCPDLSLQHRPLTGGPGSWTVARNMGRAGRRLGTGRQEGQQAWL